METIENIQAAIDYIEENIAEELDVATIASKAHMSGSHFQRVFLAICGVSVGEYIRNRKLTLAGQDITTSSAKIIDIATHYGYSPEGFSRAFSRFHKASPTAARSQGEIIHFAKISVKSMLGKEKNMENKVDATCSFCGKTESQAQVLVCCGDKEVFICDECVELCSDIIKEQINKKS
ncbi:MAG: AraC family transcriptional regulator [Defluviitaleaceae bacterium]|nr:AraC family transcriptional regulator [Defluviitaleaceae bacterium]